MNVTAARWLEVLGYCGVHATTGVKWAPLFAKHIQADRFSRGREEMDDYLGQILHESGRLEHLEENLNYRPERLMQVWPHRFPSLRDALPYAYNPEALAEKCYGMRDDLGNDQPGDGARYPGRGVIQVTGKANYALLERMMGKPLLQFPELLADPEIALRASLLWWEDKVPDSAINTLERVTRAVNGGQHGLEDRRWLTAKAAAMLS